VREESAIISRGKLDYQIEVLKTVLINA